MSERQQENDVRGGLRNGCFADPVWLPTTQVYLNWEQLFPEDYKKYLRMDAESLDYILKAVSPIISKQELQDIRLVNCCRIKKEF